MGHGLSTLGSELCSQPNLADSPISSMNFCRTFLKSGRRRTRRTSRMSAFQVFSLSSGQISPREQLFSLLTSSPPATVWTSLIRLSSQSQLQASKEDQGSIQSL